MSKKNGTFQFIDKKIFSVIDKLKTTEAYEKFSDSTSALEENVQKVVNFSLSYILIFTPLLFPVLLYLQNSSLSKKIEVKENIRTSIVKLNAAISDVKSEIRKNTSFNKVDSKVSLQSTLSKIMRKSSIPNTSMSVISFEEGRVLGLFKEYMSEISFTDITTEMLASILKELSNSYKMKIEGIDIRRSDKGLLIGNMKLVNITEVKK